jgi:acyl-CoA synthetase (AMP-forming)/AMP-acid ligase II
LESMRFAVTGGERCPPRLYVALARDWPQAAVLEGYGVTECSPIISVNDPADPRPGTIGKVLPSLEAAFVDEATGRRAVLGQAGMLLVRGESVFGGYLNYEGPSPFVEFEGKSWYRTGDLVSRDAGGVLTFVGRLKRFVKLGGEMISLPAIEAVLEGFFPPVEDPSGSLPRPQVAVESCGREDQPEITLFATCDVDR